MWENAYRRQSQYIDVQSEGFLGEVIQRQGVFICDASLYFRIKASVLLHCWEILSALVVVVLQRR